MAEFIALEFAVPPVAALVSCSNTAAVPALGSLIPFVPCVLPRALASAERPVSNDASLSVLVSREASACAGGIGAAENVAESPSRTLLTKELIAA